MTLLPKSVTEPTPGAALPADRTIGGLAAFADAEAGQLDKANVDKGEIIAFGQRCHERDDALRRSLTRHKFLGIF